MSVKKKLVLISHDALVGEDLAYLQKSEPFRSLLRDGARIRSLRSIYPTVTYPAHASLITGVYPERHGVVGNEVCSIGTLGAPWNWFRPANKSKSLFTAAKEAGMTTAAVFWPVTGNDPDIDYLVDEYWPQSPDETMREALLRAGTSEALYDAVVENRLGLLGGSPRPVHPQFDEFVVAVACDIIETYKPDLIALHPANVDAARHGNGVFSEPVTQSLDEVARMTQDVIDAAKRAGTFEETDFVILSDHGQMDVTRAVNPNVVFAERGLIKTDDAGNFLDYSAFCQSCGMSAYVYLKNPSNLGVQETVADLLEEMRRDGRYGISEVLTREEAARREHLYGSFSFVIETDGTTTFGNRWTPPVSSPLTNSDYRFGLATHGYLPDKGAQPVFIGCGPSFRKGESVERRPLVDCAPTCAAALGLSMPWAQGQAVTELLNH